MQRLKESHRGVVHCPMTSMTMGAGFMAPPVRSFLRRGIREQQVCWTPFCGICLRLLVLG